MKKLDKDFVNNYFQEHGCELLEEYKEANTVMAYICSCGNKSKTSWYNFSKGVRCKECGVKKSTQSTRLDFDHVYQYFKKQGCELLEKEYKNTQIPMRYKCSCGNISKICLNSFQSGARCKKCGVEKNVASLRLKYKDVKMAFEKRGCVLLENKYNNCCTPMRYKCSCGNISVITWNSFRNGSTCRECFKKRVSGSNCYMWNNNRDAVKLNELLGRKYTSLLRSTFRSLGRRKDSRGCVLLGYTRQELKNNLMKHPNWMNMQDIKWDIDHIFPIKAFIEHNIFDCKVINALDNLQPLEHSENCSKADKYCENDFIDWLKNKGINCAASN